MDLYSILLSIGMAILGIVVGIFVTKWSMRKQKKEAIESSIKDAANQIFGTAERIIEIEKIVKTHNDLLSNIGKGVRESCALGKTLITEIKNNTIGGIVTDEHKFESFSRYAMLDARLQQKKSEKKALGRYIIKHTSSESRFAIDCGTNVAWAFSEVVKVFDSTIKVVTNNIFIPALFLQQDHEYFESGSDIIYGIQETRSTCYVTSGYYFPSYGGILMPNNNSIDCYTDIWNKFNIDVILIGCTSFCALSGPHARSGENRRFKESLMKYACENENVKLFILLEIDKLGRSIGKSCGQKYWEYMANRENVHILMGYSGSKQDFQHYRIGEKRNDIQMNSDDMAMRKNKFLIILEGGTEIDLLATFRS
jgi:DeoR/GlpR family transcriptional regulator of sugar metabolism